MRIGRILVLAVALGTVNAAHADLFGNPGILAGLEIRTTNADGASAWKGSIWVKRKQNLQQYVWAGSNCPARDLTPEQIEYLASNLGKPWLRIIPTYRFGQLPGSRCLVGFAIVDKSIRNDVDVEAP